MPYRTPANLADAVQVVVRCRPMNKKEKEDSRTKIVKVVPEKGTVAIQDPANPGDDPKTFTFDACYDWDCKQRDVYDETAHPLIEEVLNGFNGTIFAYGQTGCGKSFTMMGLPEPPEMRGVCQISYRILALHRLCSAPLLRRLTRVLGMGAAACSRYHPERLCAHLQPHFCHDGQGVSHPRFVH